MLYIRRGKQQLFHVCYYLLCFLGDVVTTAQEVAVQSGGGVAAPRGDVAAVRPVGVAVAP